MAIEGGMRDIDASSSTSTHYRRRGKDTRVFLDIYIYIYEGERRRRRLIFSFHLCCVVCVFDLSKFMYCRPLHRQMEDSRKYVEIVRLLTMNAQFPHSQPH